MNAHLGLPSRKLFESAAAGHVAHPLLSLVFFFLDAMVLSHPLADSRLHLFFFAFGRADRHVFERDAGGEPGAEPGGAVDPPWQALSTSK